MKPDDFERAMEKIGHLAVTIEDKYRKEFESLKSKINRVMIEMKASAIMDKQISELLEKIIFLESRMKVVETNVNKVKRNRAVILE